MKENTQLLSLALSDDRLAIAIKSADARLLLDAAGLDAVIRQLGVARSQMLPAVSGMPDPEFQNVARLTGLHEVDNFEDGIAQSPVEKGAALLVKSEMFGWQMLPLSPADCSAIGGWLIGEKRAVAPPGTPLN